MKEKERRAIEMLKRSIMILQVEITDEKNPMPDYIIKEIQMDIDCLQAAIDALHAVDEQQ